MTEVSDKTYPYELLIRGNEDGTVAAHVQRRRIVALDGEVMKDEVLMPVGVTPDTVAGTPFQELIGELLVASLADGDAKAAALKALDDDLKAASLREAALKRQMEANNAAAAAVAEGLQRQLDLAKESYARLEAKVGERREARANRRRAATPPSAPATDSV